MKVSTPQDDSGRAFAVVLFLSCVSALMLVAVSMMLGVTTITPSAVLNDVDIREIFVTLRVPRVLFGFLIGGALAVVGTAYQALFRNPLASPFSLGISSGAALAASVAMLIGTVSPVFTVPLCAIAGAVCAIGVVLRIGAGRRGDEGAFLLLAGVVVSLFCSSFLTLLQYLSDYAQLFRVTRWMMGGVMVVSYTELLLVGTLVIGGAAWLLRHSRDFDLMLFGDEMAAVKGVNVRQLYRRTFLITSVIIGLVVALCGVIGFVGIIVPAIARLLVGIKHRYLFPLSFLFGGELVVLCDLLGRILVPPYEIPVGVFTAVIGGPIFVWLLVRSRGANFI